MKKTLFTIQILLFVTYYSFSQGVGIGTTAPDGSAALDITATNKGLLIPRMNLASINAIPNPARGLLVYDSAANRLMVNAGTSAIPNWQPVAGNGNGGAAWNLNGNGGTDPANQFIGTIDNQPLRFRINNIRTGELHPVSGNIFLGLRAGEVNTSGNSNIAIGQDALKFDVDGANTVAIGDSALFHNGENNPVPGALAISNTAIGSKAMFSNTIGSGNTATGRNALFANTDGSENTAFGIAALFSNTRGTLNTAVGAGALLSNTLGNDNTATGWGSLKANTTGVFNTANGAFSLIANVSGDNNTAVGFASLNNNTIGSANTGIGIRSLFANTTGIGNTAVGSESLFDNTTGAINTATGDLALRSNTTGRSNTAVGVQSLFLNRTGDFNTAIGGNALSATTGSSNNTVIGHNAAFNFNLGSGNTIIGANADAESDGLTNATAIGAGAIVSASNKVRIGNGAVTIIEGQVPFTTPSDGRYKFNVQEDVKGLDFIMQLRPVTYQFDVKRFDERVTKSPVSNYTQASYNTAAAIRRSGFIAQEVEKAANAVGYDFSGITNPQTANDHYSLSYESFVVPLVKAIQEQQKMLEAVQKQNADQKRINDELTKRLEKLESSVNK